MEYGTMNKIGLAQATEDSLFFDGTEWAPKGGVEKYATSNHNRDVADPDGPLSFTGFGFKPSAIIGLSKRNATLAFSVGFQAADIDGSVVLQISASTFQGTMGGVQIVSGFTSSGNGWQGNLTSFDTDGFTVDYTKSGTPSGTISFGYIILR